MGNCENKCKHLWNNVRAELNEMNVNKSGDPDLSPNKRESRWRGFDFYHFFVERYLECNKYGKKSAFSFCVT
jgi:hypothetical protein